MLTLEVVKCSDRTHKIECLKEVFVAAKRASRGGDHRNGRKVTIRGAITNPCTCHIDALLWLLTTEWATYGASQGMMWASFEDAYFATRCGEVA